MLEYSNISDKDGVSHGLRVKPIFHLSKMRVNLAGVLKICDDWKYTPGKQDVNVSAKDIRKMKEFLNLILYCFV